MTITSEYARQAQLAEYHRIAMEDTESELEAWLTVVFDGTAPEPATDGWARDNNDGTFSFWSQADSFYTPPAGVGDVAIVSPLGLAIIVQSYANFAAGFFPVDPPS